MSERTDTDRLEWLRGQTKIMTWKGYGPQKKWGGTFCYMTGEYAISTFGFWEFFKNYHTHFLNGKDEFIGATQPNYTETEFRSSIDTAMDAEEQK